MTRLLFGFAATAIAVVLVVLFTVKDFRDTGKLGKITGEEAMRLRAEQAAGPDRAAAAVMEAASAEDAAMMVEIRRVFQEKPILALELVWQAERKFPTSRFSEERGFLKVKSLVGAKQPGMAREEAARFYAAYPNSPYLEPLVSLTGWDPRKPSRTPANSN